MVPVGKVDDGDAHSLVLAFDLPPSQVSQRIVLQCMKAHGVLRTWSLVGLESPSISRDCDYNSFLESLVVIPFGNPRIPTLVCINFFGIPKDPYNRDPLDLHSSD